MAVEDQPPPAVSISEEVIYLLCSINREYSKTLLIVTHDPDVAAKADRQIRIADGKLYE